MTKMEKFPDYKTVSVSSLIPYARNSRTHSDAQVGQIAASIKEFGFLNPIIVDGDNGIIAGHGRVLAAQKLGLAELPVIEAGHLSDAQRRAYIIADNKLAMNADWDDEMLRVELDALGVDGFDLELTGFSLDEIADLQIEEVPEGLTDEDAVPDAPNEPVTVEGDVWVLGNHRLMCGDSTSIDAVEKLMDGQKADLIHTDPPYGIGYGGSMSLGQAKHGWTQHSGGWDEQRPPKELFDLLEAQCSNRIIWGGNYFSDFLPPTMGWLVWDKGQRGFSLADGEMAWTSFNNAMRIKEYSRAAANKEEKHHATQKPLEVVKWALEYADRHSKVKPVFILDLFGGSGTTLIACEKTNRHCRMMELDPKYCDVIINRWQQYTGKEAVLESTGEKFNSKISV
jgi:DNA modification methylase